MRFSKNRSRVVAVVAVAMLLTAGWLAFKPSPKAPATSTPGASQTTSTTKGADPAKLVTIETADFKYDKPADWVKLTPKALEPTGSASGIARVIDPIATFFIKVSSSSLPKNNDEIKSVVLDGPQHLKEFKLLSSEALKIDGQTGQSFTYTFTEGIDSRVTQQTSIVVHKQKAFFLQFKSVATDYDKQAGDFASILSSFHFK